MFHLSRVWCMRQQSRLTLLCIRYSGASHYAIFFGLVHSNISLKRFPAFVLCWRWV